MMLIGSFSAAAVTMAEHTAAAPPISALMASIPEEGFIEIPPLGYGAVNYHESRKNELFKNMNETLVKHVTCQT